jgi:hypothetical protein
VNTRRLLPVVLSLAAVLVPVWGLAACGGDDKPQTVKFTPTPSEKPTGRTTYRAKDWGFSLSYEAAEYELRSDQGSSSLLMGPSIFTGEPLDLSGRPSVNVSLLMSPADRGAATPTVSVAAQRLPFSVDAVGDGLAAWVRDDLLRQLGTSWGDVLTDKPQLGEIGGVSAWTFEAVGFDEAAAAEMHLRVSVAAFGAYIYTLRLSAPRASWDEVEPKLATVLDSFTVDKRAADPGPAPDTRPYANTEYSFSLMVPEGLVKAQEGDDPTPDLQFGAQFVDVHTTPEIALSVGVAGAPEGIGNSQARLLEQFYRKAADQLRGQKSVLSVADPAQVDLGGDTAWLLDVTSKLPDGRRLRTRTYDVWHNAYVYSISARGRAGQWSVDWQLLEPAVFSFRVD